MWVLFIINAIAFLQLIEASVPTTDSRELPDCSSNEDVANCGSRHPAIVGKQTLVGNRTVTFVWTSAPLLSGGLQNCHNASDPSCVGGLATVDAFRRFHALHEEEPSLVLPEFDYQSAFVHMHPLYWAVNWLVVKQWFGWDCYHSHPSLFHFNSSLVNFDLVQYARSFGYRPLISNLELELTSPWEGLLKDIFFDAETRLAMVLVDDPDKISPNQRSSEGDTVLRVKFLLENIRLRNLEDGCLSYDPFLDQFLNSSRYRKSDNPRCWTPIVLVTYHEPSLFARFVQEMMEVEFPPSLVIDAGGNNETLNTPQRWGLRGIWFVSYNQTMEKFDQIRIHIDESEPGITNVTRTTENMSEIPDKIKDDRFKEDIAYLQTLAVHAGENNPIRGFSQRMPAARDAADWYCLAGECPLGNLVTDAIRWYRSADVAVYHSAGLQGPGWPAGEVRTSDILEALPDTQTYCEAYMSGLSLFRMMNYSISNALFVTQFLSTADRLLQISGLRCTYNTKLEGSRLVSIEILESDSGQYRPLERRKIYRVAASDVLCNRFPPFSQMLQDDLVLEGEQPRETTFEFLYEIVGSYLTQLDSPYDGSLQGRLVNDTAIPEALEFIQTPDDCPKQTFWDQSSQSCLACPATDTRFSARTVRLVGQRESEPRLVGEIDLMNNNDMPLRVALKSSPPWIAPSLVSERDFQLSANGKHTLVFEARTETLPLGSAVGILIFSVMDGGLFPGCVADDISFTVVVTVEPRPSIAKPSIAMLVLGLSLGAFSVVLSIVCAVWVLICHKHNLVVILQSDFLLMLCLGVAVFCSSIVPLSLDDELESLHARNIACMAQYWLLSTGLLTIASALTAMMWRVRRVIITRMGVFLAFFVPLLGNLVLLYSWTVLEPRTWAIGHMPGDESDRFGHCVNNGATSRVLEAITVSITGIVLVVPMLNECVTQNGNDEFWFGKKIRTATFVCIQISIVGIPVLFLIEETNADLKYIFQVLLTASIGISTLVVIIGPIGEVRGPSVPISRNGTGREVANGRASGMAGEDSRDRPTTTPPFLTFVQHQKRSKRPYPDGLYAMATDDISENWFSDELVNEGPRDKTDSSDLEQPRYVGVVGSQKMLATTQSTTGHAVPMGDKLVPSSQIAGIDSAGQEGPFPFAKSSHYGRTTIAIDVEEQNRQAMSDSCDRTATTGEEGSHHSSTTQTVENVTSPGCNESDSGSDIVGEQSDTTDATVMEESNQTSKTATQGRMEESRQTSKTGKADGGDVSNEELPRRDTPSVDEQLEEDLEQTIVFGDSSEEENTSYIVEFSSPRKQPTILPGAARRGARQSHSKDFRHPGESRSIV